MWIFPLTLAFFIWFLFFVTFYLTLCLLFFIARLMAIRRISNFFVGFNRLALWATLNIIRRFTFFNLLFFTGFFVRFTLLFSSLLSFWLHGPPSINTCKSPTSTFYSSSTASFWILVRTTLRLTILILLSIWVAKKSSAQISFQL